MNVDGKLFLTGNKHSGQVKLEWQLLSHWKLLHSISHRNAFREVGVKYSPILIVLWLVLDANKIVSTASRSENSRCPWHN